MYFLGLLIILGTILLDLWCFSVSALCLRLVFNLIFVVARQLSCLLSLSALVVCDLHWLRC